MGSTRVKTPSAFGGAGFFPSTVCKSLVFLFSGLVAQPHGMPAPYACMSVRTYLCMYACIYVCMLVCMYVRTYVLKYRYVLESLYIEIFSGFFTVSVGQNQFIDTIGDMCQLQFRNLFLFPSSAILGFCKVLYAPSLSWAHVCVLTMHAQCTYSARTVHGHSARARNAANTTENGP